MAHAKRLGNIAAGIMREWETYGIVRQARGNGLLLGVSFGKPESAGVDEKDWWTARAVRGKMLENGVWAISDRQKTRFECIPRSIWRNPCFAKDCRLWKTLSGTSRNTGTQKAMRRVPKRRCGLLGNAGTHHKVTEQDLTRALPGRFVLAVTVGGVIGLGILRGPGEIAEVVPEPSLYLALWFVGGLFVLC